MLKITDRRDTDTDQEMASRLRLALRDHRRACGLTNGEVTIEVTVGDLTVRDSGVLQVNARPYGMEISLWDRQGDSIREIPISWGGYVEAVKFLFDLAARI